MSSSSSTSSILKEAGTRLAVLTALILLNIVNASASAAAAAAAASRPPPPLSIVDSALRRGGAGNIRGVAFCRLRSPSRSYRPSSDRLSSPRRPLPTAAFSSSRPPPASFVVDNVGRVGDRRPRDHRVGTPLASSATRTMTSSSPSSSSSRGGGDDDDVGGGSGIDVNRRPLSEILAARLVRGGGAELGNDRPVDDDVGIRACIAVAGGGSYATSSILSVPGASSVLLESVVVYDRLSFAEYVTRNEGDVDVCVDDDNVDGGHFGRRSRPNATEVGAEGKTTTMTTTTMPPPAKNDVDASFAISHDGEEDRKEGGCAGTSEDDIDGGDDVLVEANDAPSSSSSSFSSSSSSSSAFKFCSIEAAILLSKSALRRSLHLSPCLADRYMRCAGVGCTSSLVVGSGPTGSGRRGRRSRAYVACSAPGDGTRVWELELDNGDDDDDEGGGGVVRGGGGDGKPRRSRVEEEMVVSNAVLLAMVRCRERRRSRAVPREQGIDHDGDGDDDVDIAGLWGRILDRDGDFVTERRVDPRGVVAPAAAVHGDGVYPRRGGPRSAAWGASRIIDGQAQVVSILPIVASGPGRTLRMEALPPDDDVHLPRDVLIVPGSFNPPHAGHVGLANAAVSALRRLRMGERDEGGGGDSFAVAHPCRAPPSSSSASPPVPTSSTSSILRSMWDAVDGHTEDQYDPAVLFEMSVTNADKPPLDPMEVERRVDLFASLSLSLSLSPSEMPKDWAVILTNAPLFSQKTEILDGLVENDYDLPGDGGPSSRSGNGNTARGRRRRRMSFVIGTDTMVRIIDPKYYGNSREGMVSALLRMKERGVHFIVGGRLEQGSKNCSTFVNGEEEVMSLPPEVQEMFTLLSEDEFRLDISSTELRKKIEI